MDAAPILLSLTAAFFFLLIGLEELPFSFNVRRVARSVRRAARRGGEPHGVVLDRMARNTRRSVWILVGFAVASMLVLAYIRMQDTGRTAASEGLQLFGATLVLGLLFLAFAFQAWAPPLLTRVDEHLGRETADSNAAAPFDGQKS